jgi:hypothetical protein
MSHALWFLDHGIGVFPLRPQSKQPACASWDDYMCSREEANRLRQFGVRLGTLGVLDTDDRDDELWVLEQTAHRIFPDTPFLVETGRGFHRYFRLTGPLPKFIHRDGHTMEFRNVGQYVVGPDSLHPSGKKYQALGWSWRWDDIPFFPADFLFDDGSCPSASTNGNGNPFVLPEVIVEKTRHDTLHGLMHSLVSHGVPFKGALAVCRSVNRDRCRPSLADRPLDKDVDRELGDFLRRAYHQKDRADFVRAPKEGWGLAAALLEIGLPVNLALVAVKSIDPTFDPETSE